MTSRLTAAQIIAAGTYLESDFDPNTLTVNQLLGVFGYHNINFPIPYTKPKLIALFNEEIKPNTDKFKKAKLKKDNSIASDDGITDGVTGKLLSQKPAPRRNSRRTSRASTAEPQQAEEEEATHPEPPKRRRSSAQPSLGGPSRRKASAQPPLAEESEPEEPPIRKIGRSKKTSADAGTQSRRISEQYAEDSGWEDNNVFQSGAEDSSPARPSPTKAARQARRSSVSRSNQPRRSTKSSSAPPQLPPSPERVIPLPLPRPSGNSRPAPPQSDFTPELSPEVQRETAVFARASGLQHVTASPAPHYSHRVPIAVPSIVYEADEPISAAVSQEIPLPRPRFLSASPAVGEDTVEEVREDQTSEGEQEIEEQEAESAEVDEDAQHVAAVTKVIADGKRSIAVHRPPSRGGFSTSLLRILALLCTIFVSFAIHDYKTESSDLGFCDAGTKTNDLVEERIIRWQAIEECNRLNTTLSDSLAATIPSEISAVEEGTVTVHTKECPPLPILPIGPPVECTPCPRHATCTRFSVRCDTGYLLRPHVLLAFLPPPPSDIHAVSGSPASSLSELVWRVISTLSDGFPGLGSVAFPPRCVEDPRRKAKIGALGKEIDALLGQEKGRRVCSGQFDSLRIEERAGGEARKWGMELGALKGALRDAMKKKKPPHMLNTFEDTFQEAVQQLTQWGGVVTGEDTEGRHYLARDVPDMSWNCVLTVKARETWQQWRSNVFTAIFLLIAAAYGRHKRAVRRAEGKRVAGLVQVALDALRNQEFSHHADPMSAPAPYLSSLQLRDLVLQDEPSVSARARLWDRVERVVEANANVRANLEELPGGDEMRVWRWIGGIGSHHALSVAD